MSQDSAKSQQDPRLGSLLGGRYLLVSRLGAGGMGAVYRAAHLELRQAVAVKLLHPHFAEDEEVVRRFVNEARAAAAIGHPGIIRALDVGEEPDGTRYLVYELLDGSDVGRIIRARGPLPIDVALWITAALCDALEAAHERGIVHRDLKPDNVFVCRDSVGGAVKVLDFGISKIRGSLATGPGTKTGSMLGTPQYMAPEQLTDASTVDVRADIYAVGAMLFAMLAGQPPFEATSFPALVLKVVSEDPPALRAFRADVGPQLQALVSRAMSRSADDRFQSASALRRAILELSTSEARPADTDSLLAINHSADLAAETLAIAEGLSQAETEASSPTIGTVTPSQELTTHKNTTHEATHTPNERAQSDSVTAPGESSAPSPASHTPAAPPPKPIASAQPTSSGSNSLSNLLIVVSIIVGMSMFGTVRYGCYGRPDRDDNDTVAEMEDDPPAATEVDEPAARALANTRDGNAEDELPARDPDDVREAIESVVGQARQCYESTAVADGFEGRVMITFVVNTGGRVESVDFAETELDDSVFENCLRGAISQVELGPGRRIDVNYPITFSLEQAVPADDDSDRGGPPGFLRE